MWYKYFNHCQPISMQPILTVNSESTYSRREGHDIFKKLYYQHERCLVVSKCSSEWFLKMIWWAGKMSQQLRALNPFPEDSGQF